jgi:putative copper export protein
LLATKVALVVGMLTLGARNARIGRRAFRDHPAEGSESATALRSLRHSLATEIGFGAAVITLVTLLGMSSPTPME